MKRLKNSIATDTLDECGCLGAVSHQMHKRSIVLLGEGHCFQRRMGWRLLTSLTTESCDYPPHFRIQGLKDTFTVFPITCLYGLRISKKVIGHCNCSPPPDWQERKSLCSWDSNGKERMNPQRLLCATMHSKVQLRFESSAVLVGQNKSVSYKVAVILVQNSLLILLSLFHRSARRSVKRPTKRELHTQTTVIMDQFPINPH